MSNTHARSPGSIHEQLRLPGTYQTAIRVVGHIGKEHYELRKMLSETLGHVPVWAMSYSYGSWHEVSEEGWKERARAIIGIKL